MSRRPASHFFARLHRDQRGAVSLETILIIAAIAIPNPIFVLRLGWPKNRDAFDADWGQLQKESTDVTSVAPRNASVDLLDFSHLNYNARPLEPVRATLVVTHSSGWSRGESGS